MAILAGVGSSKRHTADAAVEEAYAQATKPLGGNSPDLLLLFASPTTYNQQELLDKLKEKNSNSLLVGCSTSGEISSINGSVDHSLSLMALSSDQMKFAVGLGNGPKEDSAKAGKEMAEDIIKNAGGEKPKTVLVLYDGLVSNGDNIIKGAEDVLGKEVSLVGGGAGDDSQFKQTNLYLGGKLLSNIVLGIGFFGNFSCGAGARHGLAPISRGYRVTKAKGNIIFEIEDKPAFEMYKQYLKDEIAALEAKSEPIAKITVMYPLGIHAPNEEGYLIRAVLAANEDGSIVLPGEIQEGTEVFIMIGNTEEGLAAAQGATELALQRLGGKLVKAAFIFDCNTRKIWLLSERQKEIEITKKLLGENVPIVGFYTYGELAPFGEKITTCSYHNTVDVIFLLAE